jgi:hypothetical protein
MLVEPILERRTTGISGKHITYINSATSVKPYFNHIPITAKHLGHLAPKYLVITFLSGRITGSMRRERDYLRPLPWDSVIHKGGRPDQMLTGSTCHSFFIPSRFGEQARPRPGIIHKLLHFCMKKLHDSHFAHRSHPGVNCVTNERN